MPLRSHSSAKPRLMPVATAMAERDQVAMARAELLQRLQETQRRERGEAERNATLRDTLGRTLLHAAEAVAERKGARRIRMTVVNIRDTLIAWYARRGYDLTGETRPFPYGDRRFGDPLRDDLAFVVLEKAL